MAILDQERVQRACEGKRHADELAKAYAMIITRLAEDLDTVTAEWDELKNAANVTRLPRR